MAVTHLVEESSRLRYLRVVATVGTAACLAAVQVNLEKLAAMLSQSMAFDM